MSDISKVHEKISTALQAVKGNERETFREIHLELFSEYTECLSMIQPSIDVLDKIKGTNLKRKAHNLVDWGTSAAALTLGLILHSNSPDTTMANLINFAILAAIGGMLYNTVKNTWKDYINLKPLINHEQKLVHQVNYYLAASNVLTSYMHIGNTKYMEYFGNSLFQDQQEKHRDEE